MPWKPNFSQQQQDPRFDAYRNRVGRLFRDDEEVGLLLVRTQGIATRESGRLWWTRWGKPRELLWLWKVVDAQFSDCLGPDDFADEQLREFATGRFGYYGGETFRLEWVPEDEAQRLRETDFGV